MTHRDRLELIEEIKRVQELAGIDPKNGLWLIWRQFNPIWRQSRKIERLILKDIKTGLLPPKPQSKPKPETDQDQEQYSSRWEAR